MGGRHGPCGHRDPDGGRAADERAAAEAHRLHPRGICRKGLGVERGKRRHHYPAVAPSRLFDGLVERALHHGRRHERSRAQGVCRSLQRRPDLPRQAAGQLGPQAQDRDQRSRGRDAGCEGFVLALPLPARRRRHAGRWSRLYRGGDDPAGNHAGRYGGRGTPVGRALQECGWQGSGPAAYRTARADRCRRACRSRTGFRRGEDHARP